MMPMNVGRRSAPRRVPGLLGASQPMPLPSVDPSQFPPGATAPQMPRLDPETLPPLSNDFPNASMDPSAPGVSDMMYRGPYAPGQVPPNPPQLGGPGPVFNPGQPPQMGQPGALPPGNPGQGYGYNPMRPRPNQNYGGPRVPNRQIGNHMRGL